MDEIWVDGVNSAGTFAGVFVADNEVSYFYLYVIDDDSDLSMLGALQVYCGAPDFTTSDVEVRWYDDETKVGVFIKGKLGGYYDLVAGWGLPGRYTAGAGRA